jgi:hypothetical protein
MLYVVCVYVITECNHKNKKNVLVAANSIESFATVSLLTLYVNL